MEGKFGIFACGDVGLTAVRMFCERKDTLLFVLLDRDNFWERNDEIIAELSGYKNTQIIYYTCDEDIVDISRQTDLIILAYWGRIIREPLLSAPQKGFLNCHTGLLPYGKGVHAHVWSIIENTPFGVTLMMIDSGLDTGDVIAQKEIDVTWLDTGGSLYKKAIVALSELIMDNKERIINLDFDVTPQVGKGSSHQRKELERESYIDLDEEYTGRELINILRAKTFPPFPSAWFSDGENEYEITVKIEKKERRIIKYKEIRVLDDGGNVN